MVTEEQFYQAELDIDLLTENNMIMGVGDNLCMSWYQSSRHPRCRTQDVF